MTQEEKQDEPEWDGKGLPPVGVKCEWIGGGLNHGEWGAVIVHAYHNDFAWIEKLRDNSMHTVNNPAFFREILTEEQKKAKERKEAVESMCFSVETLRCNEALKLYDLGYRMVESPE